jgi:hypothetical protein
MVRKDAVPAPTGLSLPLHSSVLTQRRFPALRRLLRESCSLVRPVARPIAWRLRGFLLSPILLEISALRAQLHGMAGREPCERLRNTVSTPIGGAMVEAELRRLAQAMEAGRGRKPPH